MLHNRNTQTTITLTFFLFLGLTLLSCETTESPIALDPPPTTGWLAIESGVEGFESAWLLAKPDGTEVHGHGDSLLADPQPGEYWILWEPVEEWNSPTLNPENRTFTEGSTETFSGPYAKIQGGMGDIAIRPEPTRIRPRWNLYGPDGFFAAGKGQRILKRRGIGEYTVVWGSMEGFATPPPAKSVLQEDATLELRANYTPVGESTGTIDIDPDPDMLQAPWQMESDLGVRFSGSGDSTITGLPLGQYAIVWGDLEGYVTPAPSEATLEEGAPIQFIGTYEASFGTVLIDPNPDSIQAPWQLESDAGAMYTGAGDSTLVDLPPGVYTLTWGEVEGYETPSPNPVSQELGAGASAMFVID